MSRLFYIFAISCLLYSAPLVAETPKEQPKKPTISDLETVRKTALDDPNNLEKRFQLAQVAFALGKYDEAKDAYEFMLLANPELDRVKLELALTEARLGNLKESKKLFEEVLTKNPPDNVKQNIQKFIAGLENEMKPDKFAGSVMFGFNRDSNANSASSTGNLTYNDVSIPLTSASQEKADMQAFAAASISHTHKFDPENNNKEYSPTWSSSATVYSTEQANLNNLNIYLLSLKTGPAVTIRDKRLSFGLNEGFNYIMLDGYEYMRVLSTEAWGSYGITDRINFNLSTSYEDRDFSNSPSITVFEDRTGHALQAKAGLGFILSEKDMLNLSGMLRHETAKKSYLENDQYSLGANYIHAFSETLFSSVATNYRESDYDDFDTFVSTTKIRNDKEKTYSATLGKKFAPNLTWTLGATLSDVNSSIQNYSYRNYKYSTSVGVNF